MFPNTKSCKLLLAYCRHIFNQISWAYAISDTNKNSMPITYTFKTNVTYEPCVKQMTTYLLLCIHLSFPWTIVKISGSTKQSIAEWGATVHRLILPAMDYTISTLFCQLRAQLVTIALPSFCEAIKPNNGYRAFPGGKAAGASCWPTTPS
jgi:hypothetical protein